MQYILSKKAILSYAVLAAVVQLPAHANTSIHTDEVRVTASRVDRELMDVNMAVSVVTAADIARSGAQTVAEVLKDIPGVEINSDGSQGMKRIRIRGENAFRTLVMIDGQKISEQKSMSGSPILVDPAMIERVEVIKGPASVLYGSDAIGGAINIITKKNGDKKLQGEASVGYTSQNEGYTSAVSLYGAAKKFRYRFGLAKDSGHDLRTPMGRAPHSNFRSKSGNMFVAYDITPDAAVGLTFDHYDLDFMAGNQFEKPENFWVDVPSWRRSKVGVFTEIKNVNDSLQRVRLDAFYQENHKLMTNHIHSKMDKFKPDPSMPMPLDKVDAVVDNEADNRLEQFGLNLQTDWAIGDNHYLVAGYEFGYDRLKAQTNLNVDILDARASYRKFLISGTFGTKGTVERETETMGRTASHALFASMESTVTDTLTLNYGARYTFVSNHIDPETSTTDLNVKLFKVPETSSLVGNFMGKVQGKIDAVADRLRANPSVKPAQDQDNSRVIFNAGALWRPSDELSVRASWAQGFRVPIMQERYLLTVMGSMKDVTEGNPELKPETSNNFEVGTRWMRGGAKLDTTVFFNLADNYIAPLLRVKDETQNRYRYENVSKARTVGIEFDGSYEIGQSGFEPYVSLAVMRRTFEIGDISTHDTGTPTVKATYGVNWSGPVKGYNVHANAFARTQSATDEYIFHTGETIHWGGSTTFNLTGGVNFGKQDRYSLDIGLFNLTNKAYRTSEHIYEAGRHVTAKFNARF